MIKEAELKTGEANPVTAIALYRFHVPFLSIEIYQSLVLMRCTFMAFIAISRLCHENPLLGVTGERSGPRDNL